MAVLNLKASGQHVALARLLNAQAEDKIAVSGLLQGEIPVVTAQAREMVADGYQTIKMKVGAQNVEADVRKVLAVNAVIHEKALLRVDANQAWSYEQAVEFAEQIGPAALEYIEEPFAETERIPDFFARTMIPVALDESLRRLDFARIKSIDGVDVIVIKPTLLGGIEHCCRLIREAHDVAIQTVVSSSFETDVGILALANLAASQTRHVAAGLNTLDWFGENLLREELKIRQGSLDVKRPRPRVDIDFNRLNKLA
jgi:O-succinylbenzoate synthase